MLVKALEILKGKILQFPFWLQFSCPAFSVIHSYTSQPLKGNMKFQLHSICMPRMCERS